MENSLIPFFAPKGIVVVGASEKETKLGFGITRNIIRSGYSGRLFLINPKGGELYGKPIHKSFEGLTQEFDLCILVIPAKFVLDGLKDCKEHGINNVVIVSGGFSETGEAGKKLEKEISEFIEKKNISVIGPNCIGVYDSNFPLDVTFLPTEELKPGKIALISHSGAICGAILDWSQTQGFGLSRMVSLGNQIDVNETDILNIVKDDEDTEVITMYLEGVSDGKRFLDVSSEISKEKPVIVLKAGKSEGSKKAIESHTGAMAGSNNAFQAAFRKAGIHSANSLEEMYIWAETFVKCPLPSGNRVAILTNAGGPGVTATDAIEEHGLKLSELGQSTKGQLVDLLPSSASVGNPVDMLASASPKDYKEALGILLNDEHVDSVIVIIPPPPMFNAKDVVIEMSSLIKASNKPVFVVLMGGKLVFAAEMFAEKIDIVTFKFPEQAASALGQLLKRRIHLNSQDHGFKAKIHDRIDILGIIDITKNTNSIGYLLDVSAFEILEKYGIKCNKPEVAESFKDAMRIAIYIYPVTTKIFSSKISHKSDFGGVILNIENNKQLQIAFDKLKYISEKHGIFEGVLIQEMANKGQEVIIGAVNDEDFGPMIMFGSGGTEVEGLNDVAFSISPLNNYDLDFMVESTWAGKKLNGFRNFKKADIKTVRETLIKLERIMLDNPKISDIEFNPMIVYPEGDGAVVVDARIKIKA